MQFLKMGACDTWNVEANILVYENERFSLPAEFHFNNWQYKFDFCQNFIFQINMHASCLLSVN